MRATFRLAVFVVCVWPSVCPAEDPVAQKPTPAVGDFYEYSPTVAFGQCTQWEVVDIAADGYLKSRCKNTFSYLLIDEDFNPGRVTDGDGKVLAEFKPFFPGIRFPLKVGDTWEGSYEGFTAFNGNQWTGEVTCEAAAFEEVIVMAGTFDAFRIECKDRWSAVGFTGTMRWTRWYAPQPRTVVKVKNSQEPRWDSELTDYYLQEP